jgi:hypothetical protein
MRLRAIVLLVGFLEANTEKASLRKVHSKVYTNAGASQALHHNKAFLSRTANLVTFYQKYAPKQVTRAGAITAGYTAADLDQALKQKYGITLTAFINKGNPAAKNDKESLVARKASLHTQLEPLKTTPNPGGYGMVKDNRIEELVAQVGETEQSADQSLKLAEMTRQKSKTLLAAEKSLRQEQAMDGTPAAERKRMDEPESTIQPSEQPSAQPTTLEEFSSYNIHGSHYRDGRQILTPKPTNAPTFQPTALPTSRPTGLDCKPNNCNMCPAAFTSCCNDFIASDESGMRCGACVADLGCKAIAYTTVPTVAPTNIPPPPTPAPPSTTPTNYPSVSPTTAVVCIPRLCNVCTAAFVSCCNVFVGKSETLCKQCVESKGCDGVGYSLPPTRSPTSLPSMLPSFSSETSVTEDRDDDDLALKMPSLPPSFEPTSAPTSYPPTSYPTSKPTSYYETQIANQRGN